MCTEIFTYLCVCIFNIHTNVYIFHLWVFCVFVRAFSRSCSFSRVWSCAALWTVAHQAPLSMGFSTQEYWSGLPCHPPGDLPDPGIEPSSLMSPALAGRFFTSGATWEARVFCGLGQMCDDMYPPSAHHTKWSKNLFPSAYSSLPSSPCQPLIFLLSP